MMFCSKCGNKVLDGSNFCQKCGSKIIIEATLNNTVPKAETGQDSQQALLNDDVVPTKTGGLKSIFRIVRNIFMGFGILLALFSMFGLVGLVIVGVIFGILVLVGWRMTVAEERKKEEQNNVLS